MCSRKRQASVTFSEGDQFTSDQDEEPKAKRSRRKVSVPTTDASGRPLPKEEIRRAKRCNTTLVGENMVHLIGVWSNCLPAKRGLCQCNILAISTKMLVASNENIM